MTAQRSCAAARRHKPDPIKVEYVNGGYDDSDEGQLQKQIRAAIAEYERKKIIERSKLGKQRLSLLAAAPSLSARKDNAITFTGRLVIQSRLRVCSN